MRTCRVGILAVVRSVATQMDDKSQNISRRLALRFAKTAVPTLLLISCSACHEHQTNAATKPAPEVTFKPQEMADALHAVIAADRNIYSRHILQRLASDEKLVKVSEHWQEEKALP